MTGRTKIAAAGAFLASACATAQPQEQPIPVRGETAGKTCDNSGLRDFVGRQRSPQLQAQLLASSGAASVRWVPQGTAVTMEYRSDRVTAYLDSNGRIERLSCS